MSEIVLVPSAEQDAYWQEFTQLKLATCYVRDYRNSIGRSERGVAILRAITSSVSVAAWAVWRKYALVWAFFIALAQVADALKDVLPLHKRRQALSRWSNALNRLFVDAQRDWESISIGRVKDERISTLTHQLRLKMQRYEAKYAPDGLPNKEKLFLAAQAEMESFFRVRYSLGDGEVSVHGKARDDNGV